MATQALSTISLVQNSAFGAVMLWKFGKAYQDEKIGARPILTSFFLVLPLVLHGPTLEEIRSTNQSSGLSKFVSKLTVHRERLLAVHERALQLRGQTLEALSAAVASDLLSVDYQSGHVRANDVTVPKMPERTKHHMSGADKLGKWFARIPPNLAFSMLRVEP